MSIDRTSSVDCSNKETILLLNPSYLLVCYEHVTRIVLCLEVCLPSESLNIRRLLLPVHKMLCINVHVIQPHNLSIRLGLAGKDTVAWLSYYTYARTYVAICYQNT